MRDDRLYDDHEAAVGRGLRLESLTFAWTIVEV